MNRYESKKSLPVNCICFYVVVSTESNSLWPMFNYFRGQIDHTEFDAYTNNGQQLLELNNLEENIVYFIASSPHNTQNRPYIYILPFFVVVCRRFFGFSIRLHLFWHILNVSRVPALCTVQLSIAWIQTILSSCVILCTLHNHIRHTHIYMNLKPWNKVIKRSRWFHLNQ